MSRPAVTVAICLFNSSRFIDETLDSVFAQTFTDFEVVLVDDGSTDGCADAVARRFPDTRILRQPHQGLSHARRATIAAAKADYVAFLDHDDIWLPHKLELQMAAARSDRDVALLCSDCLYVDERGEPLRTTSEHYELAGVDLGGRRGYAELLRRGCFVWQSTVVARTDALRAVDAFNPAYPYIADYETWLRLARRYPMHYTPEVLAKWRVHPTQFTHRCPDVTLADHRELLGTLCRTASIPASIRVAIGDRLLGQHRDSFRILLRQRRYRAAARAAIGMVSYPDRLLEYIQARLAQTPLNGVMRLVRYTIHVPIRARRHIRRRPRPSTTTHVWIDGSALGLTQTGYFSLVTGLIRTLVDRERCVVHVAATAAGRAALKRSVHDRRVKLHRLGWRAFRWTDIYHLVAGAPAQLLTLVAWTSTIAAGALMGIRAAIAAGILAAIGQAAWLLDDLIASARERLGQTPRRLSARVIRKLCLVLARPRGAPPFTNTVEVIVWRERFRWSGSRRIAVVQDLTTKLHPELHTPGNVAEFDEFIDYAQRHAEAIATISEHSRRDIVERLDVFPDSVSLMPMPLHPAYVSPSFSETFVAMHGVTRPYVLHVGCIEPRKNLRRLVRAFEMLNGEPAASDHVLVLAGPQGWDEGFARFLAESDAAARVQTIGFVPLEHLPSLYHFASAVVCPSVYEGFGLPVLEAMGSSAVVIASSTSSLPEDLGDGITFDPHRTEAIAAALLEALSMAADERARYRRRCRLRAEQLMERAARMPALPGLSAPRTVALA